MRPMVLALLLAVPVLAQFDGITGSASRTVTLAPDEAVVTIAITTDLGVTRQQALDILQKAGFASPSLNAAVAQPNYYGPDAVAQLGYQFTLTATATDLKDINDKLEAFRTGKPDTVRTVQYQSYLRAARQSVDDQRQKLIPQLLAEARKRAETLAAAAGLTLGAIQGVTDNSYGSYPSNGYLLGNVISGTVGGFSSSDSGGLQMNFSVTVKFAAN